MKKPIIALLLGLSLLFAVIPAASATEGADISADTALTGTGFESLSFLTDKDEKTYISGENATLILTNEAGIGSLYLLFDEAVESYTVTADGVQHTAKSGYLHDFLDLSAIFDTAPTSVTIQFNGRVTLSEIYVFAPGPVPDFVQTWQAPLEGSADMVLFATHGDDDQLYFAGLLPLYAGEQGRRVQVVYLTDHRSGPWADNRRMHEMLNGLWATGVTAYPVFGTFADFRIDDLQGTYDEYKFNYNTSEEELQAFVVEQIRRFKPLVAVGHDIRGEYGHGMHQVYTDLLIKALSLTGDETQFPESAEQYGTWELSKLYLHLYKENPILLDIDTPLTRFDGLTAFQASQELGFSCHETQHIHGFYKWLHGENNEITMASQIEKYNPAQYGLYYTAVGPDTGSNDLFENVTPYQLPGEAPQEPAPQPAPQPAPTEDPAPAELPWRLWVLIGVDGLVIAGGILAIVQIQRKKAKKSP